jgi:hypothetical protein
MTNQNNLKVGDGATIFYPWISQGKGKHYSVKKGRANPEKVTVDRVTPKRIYVKDKHGMEYYFDRETKKGLSAGLQRHLLGTITPEDEAIMRIGVKNGPPKPSPLLKLPQI